MRRGFVRVLWGEYKTAGMKTRRREDMDVDIKNLLHNKYETCDNPEYERLTLVFGDENYRKMCDFGFKCVLLDKRSEVWSRNGHMKTWMHKLEGIQVATDYFDEFIFVDFDCMQIKPLPANFWEEHYNKDPIQASLSNYNIMRAVWRKEVHNRVKKIVPSACYIYIREHKIVSELIEKYIEMNDQGILTTEEDAMAKYMDDLYGGWQGYDHYWNHFEPEFYVHHALDNKKMIYRDGRVDIDKVCFGHFQEPKGLIEKAIDNGEEWLHNAPNNV